MGTGHYVSSFDSFVVYLIVAVCQNIVQVKEHCVNGSRYINYNNVFNSDSTKILFGSTLIVFLIDIRNMCTFDIAGIVK